MKESECNCLYIHGQRCIKPPAGKAGADTLLSTAWPNTVVCIKHPASLQQHTPSLKRHYTCTPRPVQCCGRIMSSYHNHTHPPASQSVMTPLPPSAAFFTCTQTSSDDIHGSRVFQATMYVSRKAYCMHAMLQYVSPRPTNTNNCGVHAAGAPLVDGCCLSTLPALMHSSAWCHALSLSWHCLCSCCGCHH